MSVRHRVRAKDVVLAFAAFGLAAGGFAACGLSEQGTLVVDSKDATASDHAVAPNGDGASDAGTTPNDAAIADASIDGKTSSFDAGTTYDGAACIAACPVDAGGACNGAGVCVFNCVAAGDCPNKTTCPPGLACSITCDNQKCGGGIDCTQASSCSITCISPNACGGIMCGGPPGSIDASASASNCTIACVDNNSCGAVMTNATTSDVECESNNACGAVTCGGGDCTIDCDGGKNCNTIKCCATTCKDDATETGCN